MDPIEVIVRRGDVVEATHVVHAVVVRDGEVIEEAGDSGHVAFLRSSAKPFQALPLVRARDDLTTEEIAIASASHLASPEQLAAVRSLLAKAPAVEDELECGPAADCDPPQLLGQARGHARPLPHSMDGRAAGTGSRRILSSTVACTRSPPLPMPTRTRSRPRSTAAVCSRLPCRWNEWR